MFRKFKSEQLDFITKICEEHYEGKFDKYEKVRNEFGKFFKQDDLIYQIDDKAEKTTVKNLDLDKASRNELSYTEGLVMNLNDRVKHIACLLETFTKTMIPAKHTISNFDD